MRNERTPSGNKVVVASATQINYVALHVITASDLTYIDSLGVTTTLTAVPAGTKIECQVVVVSTCTGVVIGYVP